MVIVDTTVWIDYIGGIHNPESDWLDREFGRQRLGLTDLIFCEVLQGYRDDAMFERVRLQLQHFVIFEAGGKELAVAAARNFRLLRRHGFTVRKTIDCWIASFCIRERHSLLHRDRDFDPFEKVLGLKVVHP